MVHVPTRGDNPVRLGPTVPNTPEYGPSKMSRLDQTICHLKFRALILQTRISRHQL